MRRGWAGSGAAEPDSWRLGDVAGIDSDSQGLVMGAIIIGMTCRSTQQRSPYESCLNGPFKGLYRLDDLKGDSRNLALLSTWRLFINYNLLIIYHIFKPSKLKLFE